jgi:hypothetical protein
MLNHVKNPLLCGFNNQWFLVFFLGGDLSCAMEKHPTHPAILMLEAGAGSLCRLMKIFLSRPGGSWVWRPDVPGKFHQNDGDFTYGEMAISS